MADKLLAEWFWTDRWMGSSGFLLPLEARGLYREMLTQAWRRGAELPDDAATIQRACGVTAAEWGRCWPLVKRYWRKKGRVLVNDTQAGVYRAAAEQHERAVVRARKGAAARHAQATTNVGAQAPAQADSQAGAQAQPEHCPPSPSPSQTLLPPKPPLPDEGGRDEGGNGQARKRNRRPRPLSAEELLS